MRMGKKNDQDDQEKEQTQDMLLPILKKSMSSKDIPGMSGQVN